MREHSITDEQLYVFRNRSREAGDTRMAELCQRAIDGNGRSRKKCAAAWTAHEAKREAEFAAWAQAETIRRGAIFAMRMLESSLTPEVETLTYQEWRTKLWDAPRFRKD